MDQRPTHAPGFPLDATTSRFAQLLRAGDVSTKRVCSLLKVASTDDIGRLPHPVLLSRADTGRLGDTLILLFVLGQALRVEQVTPALAPLSLEQFVSAGLLETDGTLVASPVSITPYEDILVMHDRMIPGSPLRDDYTMGVAGTTRIVATQMIRRPDGKSTVGATLDLGTGCGPLAMIAARYSKSVTGTDRNERALAYARTNAILNGFTNCRFLPGDWAEPVRGQTFDNIICNPPFVMSPGLKYMYRDSGMKGDGIAEKLIESGGAMLNPGGYQSMVCNYAHVRGCPPPERLRAWADKSGCDMLVLTRKTFDLMEYAAAWIDETEHVAPDRKWGILQEWLGAYESLGIEAISEAFIVLHKPRADESRPRWFAMETLPDRPGTPPFADHLIDIIAARSFLASLGTDEQSALDRSCLSSSDHLRLDRQSMPTDQGWQTCKAEFSLARGHGFTIPTDETVAHVITSLDSSGSIHEKVELAASRLGVNREALMAACVRTCREMLEKGFLRPPR